MKFWEEHVHHVDRVLKQLEEYQQYAKPFKQLWNWAVIEFLIKWNNFPIENATWKYEFVMHTNLNVIKCWGKHLFEEEW